MPIRSVHSGKVKIVLERLKQSPSIRLALAIAAGLVLAHAVNETMGLLWTEYLEDFLYQNGWMLFDLAFAAGLIVLIVWKRRSVLNWTDSHRRGVVIGFCSVVLLCFVLIAISVSNNKKAATPVTFDFSKAIPIGGAPDADNPRPDVQRAPPPQDPNQFAHLLDLQKRAGIVANSPNVNAPRPAPHKR